MDIQRWCDTSRLYSRGVDISLMDFLPELLKQGIVGLVAGVFLWLYLQEKRDHEKTRQSLITSFIDRLADSEKNTVSVITTAQGMSQSVALLTEKIEISKGKR